VVVEGASSRNVLEKLLGALCDALAEPVSIEDATFQLLPCAGVALLGQDAKKPQALLEHARNAMLEARRSSIPDVRFYSETLRMRPMSRLDFERELRGALEADQLRLRYVARHSLASGERLAVHAYLRWPHPLRGDVRPAEFLPIAHGTGLSVPLSRWALGRLQRDLPALRRAVGRRLRVSFGPLRHHLTGDALATDVEELLRSGDLAADELELRLAERAVAGLDAPDRAIGKLADLGVSLMIDEFARSYSSLSRLVYLPFQSLQVDRSFVRAVDEDPAALRVCVAAASLARNFGMTPVAAGVDGAVDAERMRDAGYEQGLGDYFDAVTLPAAEDPPAESGRRARARR
jgi:predicted signal transduction protein with EAL and GGDEF domain